MRFDAVRRPSWWAAAIPLAALLLGSVIGRGGLLEINRLHSEHGALSEEVFRLLRTNEALRERIITLRRSDRHLERLARQELGLVRDQEIVYRFGSRVEAPAQGR